MLGKSVPKLSREYRASARGNAPHKDDLVPRGAGGVDWNGSFGVSLTREWSAARTSANENLQAEGKLDGDSVLTYFNKREQSLRSIDPTFLVEMRFFAAMVGTPGEKILQRRVMELLPSPTGGQVTEQEALSELKRLEASDLFKFTGASARGSVLTVASLVADLCDGRLPSFATNPSPFLVEVKLRLALFARHIPSDGTGVLVGEAAVRCLTQQALEATEVDLEALEKPIKFAWLLNDELAGKLETMRKAAVESASASLAMLASSSGPKREAPTIESAAQVAKKAKASNSEMESALAMFKGFG